MFGSETHREGRPTVAEHVQMMMREAGIADAELRAQPKTRAIRSEGFGENRKEA